MSSESLTRLQYCLMCGGSCNELQKGYHSGSSTVFTSMLRDLPIFLPRALIITIGSQGLGRLGFRA